jgi:hypothetical protein
MSGERRLDRQSIEEPSLGMSFGVLCLVLLGIFVIVININVPDIQLDLASDNPSSQNQSNGLTSFGQARSHTAAGPPHGP